LWNSFDSIQHFFATIEQKNDNPKILADQGCRAESSFCMNIVSKKDNLLKSFWLYFHIFGNGDEWIEYGLPIPTLHKHINKGYFIGWALDGFFDTAKGREFLNDIIARFLISFSDTGIERLDYKPKEKDLDEQTARIYKKVYKLREFSRKLESLPTKKYIPKRANNFKDFAFWAIKLHSEDMIRATGFIVYDSLESWALSQFIDKERSTIRAKCRSVFRWYEARDFQLSKTQEKKYKNNQEKFKGTKMTRVEHIKRVGKEKKEKNRRKVINLITGLYSFDYKKKNGKWHYQKIAEATGLSRYTVSTIIKELENSKEEKDL